MSKIDPRIKENLSHHEEAIAEKKRALIRGLPHLYEKGWYQWAWDFFKSTNKMNLLCASNQSGKSSTQIRKIIEWCGNPSLWPSLWKEEHCPPRQMWYLYPSVDVTRVEFDMKWVPEFLPRDEYKNHPTYGWKVTLGDKRAPSIVTFNSGASIVFKTYMQNPQTLQSSTAHAIFCFVSGTLIQTDLGPKPIETIEVGDKVLTANGGFEPVVSTTAHKSEVFTRKFSNGGSITSTKDHPFWSETRGWVDFCDLTLHDKCVTLRGWKQIKRLYCLKRSFLSATRSLQTIGKETISGAVKAVNCTWLYGRLCTVVKSLRIRSYTTQTSTLSTIAHTTCSFSPGQSTQESTRWLSGGIRSFTPRHARDAGLSSFLEAVKRPLENSVLRFVGESTYRGIVHLVVLLLRRAKTALRRHALKPARLYCVSNPEATSQRQTVYNIKVANSPTYFANGILVHNCDEEIPFNLYDEINMRLAAVEGYFHMVFTATLNQDFWRMAIEGKGATERFPNAFKQQISMRDCFTYRDGRPGNFDEQKVKDIESRCRSETERLRRVEGRFVTEGGLMYPQFDAARHYKKPFTIPPDWRRYCGVDLGSGGRAHPPAIMFVAVRPDCRMGVVYKGWKGDDGPTYTCGDVFNKFLDLRGRDILARQVFDFQAKDFGTIAQRAGEPFSPANKSHERGIDIINTLFKNDMLFLFDTEEIQKLGSEFSTVMMGGDRRHKSDDASDSVRYALVEVPWDWSFLQGDLTEEQIVARDTRPYTEEERKLMEIQERRGEMEPKKVGADWGELDEEFEFWNQAAGGH